MQSSELINTTIQPQYFTHKHKKNRSYHSSFLSQAGLFSSHDRMLSEIYSVTLDYKGPLNFNLARLFYTSTITKEMRTSSLSFVVLMLKVSACTLVRDICKTLSSQRVSRVLFIQLSLRI